MVEIDCDPEFINGNPRIKGTRLSVLDVVSAAKQNGVDYVLQHHGLQVSDLKIVLNYCVTRQCDNTSHCGGCSLRPHQDNVFTAQQYIDRFEKVLFTDSEVILTGAGVGKTILPGTEDDVPETWYGVNGWIWAGEIFSEINERK